MAIPFVHGPAKKLTASICAFRVPATTAKGVAACGIPPADTPIIALTLVDIGEPLLRRRQQFGRVKGARIALQIGIQPDLRRHTAGQTAVPIQPRGFDVEAHFRVALRYRSFSR